MSDFQFFRWIAHGLSRLRACCTPEGVWKVLRLLLIFPQNQLLNPFWRRRAGVSWKALDPQLRVGELTLPLLILHGSLDESVPVRHANALASAAGTEAVVMEGKDHSNLLDAPELHELVNSFLSDFSC